MYTKAEIINIAQKQLSLDYNCKPSDFKKDTFWPCSISRSFFHAAFEAPF